MADRLRYLDMLFFLRIEFKLVIVSSTIALTIILGMYVKGEFQIRYLTLYFTIWINHSV